MPYHEPSDAPGSSFVGGPAAFRIRIRSLKQPCHRWAKALDTMTPIWEDGTPSYVGHWGLLPQLRAHPETEPLLHNQPPSITGRTCLCAIGQMLDVWNCWKVAEEPSTHQPMLTQSCPACGQNNGCGHMNTPDPRPTGLAKRWIRDCVYNVYIAYTDAMSTFALTLQGTRTL